MNKETSLFSRFSSAGGPAVSNFIYPFHEGKKWASLKWPLTAGVLALCVAAVMSATVLISVPVAVVMALTGFAMTWHTVALVWKIARCH